MIDYKNEDFVFELKPSKKKRIKFYDNARLAFYFCIGTKILTQTGTLSKNSKLINAFFFLFAMDVFKRYRRQKISLLLYLFPVWIVTLPLGILLSQLFPKTTNTSCSYLNYTL